MTLADFTEATLAKAMQNSGGYGETYRRYMDRLYLWVVWREPHFKTKDNNDGDPKDSSE